MTSEAVEGKEARFTLASSLRRDPWVLAGLGLGGLAVLVHGLGGQAVAESNLLIFVWYSAFLLLAGLATGERFWRSDRRSERRFWGLLSWAYVFWFLASLHFLVAGWVGLQSLVTQTLIDVAFAFYYLSTVLAAEQRPELGSESPRRDPDQRLELLGLHIFALGLLGYFVILPNLLGPSLGSKGQTLESYLLFLALDLYLLGRFVFLRGVSPQPVWSRIYSVLALAHLVWSLTDMYEMLSVLPEPAVTIAPILTPAWYLPFLGAVVAARIRAVSLTAEPRVETELPRSEQRPRRLVLFLFLLVLMHLVIGTFAETGDLTQRVRGGLVLVLVVALGLLAQFQYRILDRRTLTLGAEREAALAELRASEDLLRQHNEMLQDFNERLTKRVAERTEQVQKTRDVALLTLARLTESRDPETGRHLERIASFSVLLAELLTRGEWQGRTHTDFVDGIRRSSPLHDIGKVGIPDSILLKPGPLTPDEMEIMRTHTTIGGDTLRSIVEDHPGEGLLRMGMEIAYSHHERWSGDGYPHGLRGEEIPLAARIVALVDAYDAITSVRPYKDALPHEVAVERIRKDRGAHFDPVVVDAFLICSDEFRRLRTESGPPALLAEETGPVDRP